MPEVNQYMFAHKELLEMLVKQAGVHEGKWTISINFGFSAGIIGPSPEELSPGAVVAIQQIGIQRASPDAPEAITIDAAAINPPMKTG